MGTGWRNRPGARVVAPRPAAVSIERLRELFRYDSETGVITNRSTRGNAKAGQRSGTVGPAGYRRIAVDGVNLKAHHIAWAIHHGQWPASLIDHINRNKADDRIANLRLATVSQNNHNTWPKPNKFGLAGVSQSKGRDRFKSAICIDRQTRHLGTFDTAEEAHRAYAEAKLQFLKQI